MLAQSWVKQRQRQKTGDYRPTGSGGPTTPAKGKEHRSFSAALVRGRGGSNNQPTNKQAGRGDARLNQAAREAEAGGSSESQGSLVSTASSRAGGETSSGSKEPNPNPAAPRADGPSLPSVFLEAGGELQPPGSPQCPPHLPPGSWPGPLAQPGRANGGLGRSLQFRTLPGPPRGARRGAGDPTPGDTSAGDVPRQRLPIGSHHDRPAPAGRDFSGETAAARVLSPPAERCPAKTDSHGAEAQSPFFPQAPSSARPCPPHLRKSERPVGREMSPNRRRRSPAAAATNTDKMASAPSPHNLLRWI